MYLYNNWVLTGAKSASFSSCVNFLYSKRSCKKWNTKQLISNTPGFHLVCVWGVGVDWEAFGYLPLGLDRLCWHNFQHNGALQRIKIYGSIIGKHFRLKKNNRHRLASHTLPLWLARLPLTFCNCVYYTVESRPTFLTFDHLYMVPIMITRITCSRHYLEWICSYSCS